MRTLEDQLANYATYHRDTRNIATHFVGIPMIVAAVAALLSRPGFEVAGLALTPAWVAAAAAAVFYLRLDLVLGLLMTALFAASVAFGGWLAAMSTGAWLGISIGMFVVGWAFQFLGHAYEGRKPAFVDDLAGFLVGPLFVVCEALFAVGALKGLQHRIEERAGPTRNGPSAASA